MQVLKNVIKSMLRQRGYELCRLHEEEKGEVPGHEWMTYREAQLYRGMSFMGQISVAEARFLGGMVRDSDPNRPIIEIGTLFGFSTLVMTLFKHPAQRLITVDNYSWNPLGLRPEAHRQLTRDRLAEIVKDHNVVVINADKNEFFKSYDEGPPSLFFCDADHTYEQTKVDLLWARSVGATTICGDDYHPVLHKGVTRAVDELGGPRQLVDGLFVL